MIASDALYISILTGLAYSDIKTLEIPNIIVIPGIFIGICLTGYWQFALVLFLIGSLFFHYEILCGGDVKLISMVGAFMGPESGGILILAGVLITIYHFKKKIYDPAPLTPWVLIPSLFFIW